MNSSQSKGLSAGILLSKFVQLCLSSQNFKILSCFSNVGLCFSEVSAILNYFSQFNRLLASIYCLSLSNFASVSKITKF